MAADISKLENLVNFFADVMNLKLFELKTSASDLSESTKTAHAESMRDRIELLKLKYKDILEKPEQTYLMNLVNFYIIKQEKMTSNSPTLFNGKIEGESADKKTIAENLLDIPLDKLNLGKKVSNNIYAVVQAYFSEKGLPPSNVYLGDILRMKEGDFLNHRNFGLTSLDKLHQAVSSLQIADKKLSFGMKETEYMNPEHRKNMSLEHVSEKELERLDMPIKEIDMTVRTLRSLQAYSRITGSNIEYLGDIVKLTRPQLKRYPSYFTRRVTKELIDIALLNGFSLGSHIEYRKPEERGQEA